MPQVLVQVIRSGITESLHYGHIAVTDSNGHLFYHVGNPDRLTFFRSAVKPILTVAALTTGIAEKYCLSTEEIAIMSSSHSGQKRHTDLLKQIIQKIGVREEQLQCGTHPPLHKESERELYASGSAPTPLHCNCSGKHLAFIASSKALGYPVEGYLCVDHPIHDLFDRTVSDFCRVPQQKILKGVDGCGLPVYGLPLSNMACAYANLADTEFMNGRYAMLQKKVVASMVSHPWLIGGDKRLDTLLMQNFGDRLISKIGAEGAHCTGLIGKKTGCALRIEDGSLRAVDPAAIELLRQLGIIDDCDLEKVRHSWNPPLLNHKKEKVGELKAFFDLEML